MPARCSSSGGGLFLDVRLQPGQPRICPECPGGGGRAREAIAPLQAALRGGIERPQLYLTRTEIHDWLARAFDAAGRPDSAAPHFRYVARMWAEADSIWQERQQQAAGWLAQRGYSR